MFIYENSSIYFMNNQALLSQTDKYLDDYLEAFVIQNKKSDIQYSAYGVPIPAHSVQQFDDVDAVDLHKERFKQLYDSLPESELFDFVRALSDIENVVLIDIGNMLYGADFSLWVAAQNPSADIHIYNPDIDHEFPPFLFNDFNKEQVFKLKTLALFDHSDPKSSTKKLFESNGLPNISYHYEKIEKGCLEKIAQENADRQVVFFSRRTPTTPKEMTSQIACVVNDNENTHMILMPLINTKINAYKDDRIIELINRYNFAREHYKDPTSEPCANAATRLYTAMQQYYALKAASVVGERAEIYKEAHFETGFPFHHPTHYVSTIEPKKT